MLNKSFQSSASHTSEAAFHKRGWCTFTHDPQIAAWCEHVRPSAVRAVSAPENAQWLRYGGTWFAGVNALDNDTAGCVDGGPPLAGSMVNFISAELGLDAGRDYVWDRGQISVCYPGYPRQMAGETDGAFNYRVKRDAAHLDGVHPVGADRRRHLREPHAFIVGIPLTRADRSASPLVVWDGSHELIRAALAERLSGLAPDAWQAEDITQAYQSVRREIFETCQRTVVHAAPGECYLLHRLALHGVSPWQDGAEVERDGRMIVYFRPELSWHEKDAAAAWLQRA